MRNFLLIILLCSLAIYLTTQQETTENKRMYAATEKSNEPLSPEIEANIAPSKDTVSVVNAQENSHSETSDQTGSDDCIFDQATQTDEFVRNIPEFADYSWDDSAKTATILLPAGDTLYATRGGCDHFMFIGKLVKKGNDHAIDDQSYWLEQGAWIAKRILPQADYDEYLTMVENKKFEAVVQDEMLSILFNDSQALDWTLNVYLDKEKDQTTIETGYYIN